MVDGLEFFNALAASARNNERLKSEFPDFEKQLKDILSSLKQVADKFKDGYAIKSSETAMETLRKFIVDSTLRAREQDARSKALHDMAEAMIPQVTDAQMQAYQAQKQTYDAHEKNLKAQTDAIVKAANAQTKAAQKEAAKKNEAIDREIANEKKRGALIESSLKRPLDAGEGLSKVDGRDTLLTQAFSGLKGALGERKAQDEAAIAEAYAPQREAIAAELAERLKAITEEKDARIAAAKEAMAEIAKKGGIVKPEDPRKLRDAQVAEAAKGASKLKGIDEVASGAIAAEAAQIADKLQPVMAPTNDSLEDIGEALVTLSDGVKDIAGAAKVASAAVGAAASGAGLPGGPGEVPEAEAESTSDEKDTSASDALAEAGEAAGALGGLGNIAKSVGTLSSTVGKFQPFLAPVVQILSDIDNTLPVVSTGISAIADASRILGPTLFTALMDLGAYIVEAVNGIIEALPGTSRSEEIKANAELMDRARARYVKAPELESPSGDIKGGNLTANLLVAGDGDGGRYVPRTVPRKIEGTLTTAKDVSSSTQKAQEPSTQTDAALQAVERMAAAQEQAARRQMEVGVGTTPLIMSNPSLAAFPV